MERNNLPQKIAVIGGGLSGCILALRLLEQGYTPVVFDEGTTNASRVAAGLWNPVVFKRLTPSWMAEQLVKEVFKFYPKWQEKLGASFFFPMLIFKLINDNEELLMWQRKANDADLFDFINPTLQSFESDVYQAQLGYCAVHKSGYVNTTVFLDSCFNYLDDLGLLNIRSVNYAEFVMNEDNLLFEDFDAVVFAQGYAAKDNPFFNQIKFNLCKGDVLEIEANGLLTDAVINNEGFMVPFGNNRYKVGSTYVWDFQNSLPTQDGLQAISNKVNNLIKTPFKVLQHQAGIRPTTIDRRPVLGVHPIYKNAYIFNGMGTKGIMLAPYFSKIIIEEMNTAKVNNTQVTYSRFI